MISLEQQPPPLSKEKHPVCGMVEERIVMQLINLMELGDKLNIVQKYIWVPTLNGLEKKMVTGFVKSHGQKSFIVTKGSLAGLVAADVQSETGREAICSDWSIDLTDEQIKKMKVETDQQEKIYIGLRYINVNKMCLGQSLSIYIMNYLRTFPDHVDSIDINAMRDNFWLNFHPHPPIVTKIEKPGD